jgi:hypothetical protein
MKVGVIVEGDSDKDFFEKYFKIEIKPEMIIVSSGGSRSCRILNKPAMHKDIKALTARGCEHVFVLVDLDTKCETTQGQFTCILELKEWYRHKIGIDSFNNVTVTVVSKEIEAWMLSAWENSNGKMKKDLEKKFNSKKSLSEKEMVKKFIGSKRPIDRTNNDSLEYFMSKLGI